MQSLRPRLPVATALSAALVAVAAGPVRARTGDDVVAKAPARFSSPTSSAPIVVSPDDRFVWVVNPDVDTVTELAVTASGLAVRSTVRVGDEPTNLAITPDGRFVYVANTVSGTVSVIRTKDHRVVDRIRVGTEPYGLAFTPNGSKLYVANARSNDISVIDPDENEVVRTIQDVGPEPRGLAITNDGDRRDNDEKLYVTQFLATDRPGVLIGRDDYKEGRVTVIDVGDDEVEGFAVLNPLADTGFRSNGSALGRIAATDPPTFTVQTGAFPNMLNSIAIKGGRAYLPNTAASADGPVRFNVNVQAFLSVLDIKTDTEGSAGGVTQTFNMNRGVNFEPAGPRLFFAMPWHVAFAHAADVGYVVSAASNVVVKVDLDAEGTPTIHAPAHPGDPGAVVRIAVGQNPRGIAIDSQDRRAYVANEVSRDVSVIDLATNTVVATVASADLPPAGSDAARLLIGKALFNTSTGVQLPALGPLGVTPLRMSADGWSACAACHPNGLTDGVVWIFGAGPRRTLPLNGTFNPHDPADQKLLNYSAIFDEVQDFENNIRAVSGGQGLITLADGTTPDPVLNAFALANTGRSERLDLLAEYVARGIRTPLSPLDAGSHDVERGRRLFDRANCAACHGGGGWASSRRDYTPPPDPALIVNGQVIGALRQVGTFDAAAANEIRQNGAAPLGAAGFNPPSLLGAHGLGPVLHNGSALRIEDVLENVVHRSAGTGGVDRLGRQRDRERLAEFVRSIDAGTEPFAITPLLTAQQAKAMPDEAATGPDATALRLDPFANPVRGPATVGFELGRAGRAEVTVYDVRGARVAVLAAGVRPAGRCSVTWDGRLKNGQPAAAGLYFVRLRSADTSLVRKLVLAH